MRLDEIQNRLTERRAILTQLAYEELQAIFPQYEGKQGTHYLRQEIGSRVAQKIRYVINDPFTLEVSDDGYGRWSFHIEPKMTEFEVAAQEEEFRRIDEEARQAQIDAAKRHAAEFASRAEVIRKYPGDYVSIAGMIEDLSHWQVPPDLYNEESVGFRRAVADVIRYLKARERLG